MAEWCHLCGRNINLVGRVHHCVPIRGGLRPSDLMAPGRQGANIATAPKKGVNVLTLPDRYTVGESKPVNTANKPNKAAKRRAYMKKYMQKRRGKQGD